MTPADSATYYRCARTALGEARQWSRLPLPLRMTGGERGELESYRALAVCALLVEAGILRGLARSSRAS